MAFYDAYIGLLEDPEFDWDNGSYSGNVPNSIGVSFPIVHTGSYLPTPADQVYSMANELPDEKAKSLDWGSAGVKVKKDELMALCREWYAEYPDELDQALRACQGMLPHKVYVLVTMES